ncbi:GntR family transcriptional regulator [Nocardia sp. NPDC004604]|uniref:GntR family transcriptional regulator n=1 Tax=Nocardia sp. NPDC004604 TaxID=3157013 RepID=UPI0033AAF460
MASTFLSAEGASPAPSSGLRRVVRTPARQRISDRVHDELTSAIRDLRLEPGALLSEAELSVQLGVSRTPLREAISRLVDQGLLSVVSQVRTSVALIDLSEVREACFIRRALETAAFREACESGGDVGGLRRILLRQEQAVADRDVEDFFVSDEDLHQEIFRLAGYPGVWSMIRRSKLQLDRLRRLAFSETVITRDVIDEHIRIVDLLENRDVEEGMRLITEHSRHVLDQADRVRSEYPGYFTP